MRIQLSKVEALFRLYNFEEEFDTYILLLFSSCSSEMTVMSNCAWKKAHFKSHKSVNVESVANILLSISNYIWSRKDSAEFLRDSAVFGLYNVKVL